MTYNKTKTMKNAHETYLKSNLYTLNDCYTNASYNKQKAYNYCRDLLVKYNGRQGRILGYNTMTFSYGFIGEMDGKPAFFYITKNYDRYIYIDDLEENKRKNMWVCERCLCAIESREGTQATMKHYVDEESETESKCDWCEENGFDALFELV